MILFYDRFHYLSLNYRGKKTLFSSTLEITTLTERREKKGEKKLRIERKGGGKLIFMRAEREIKFRKLMLEKRLENFPKGSLGAITINKHVAKGQGYPSFYIRGGKRDLR